MAEQQEDSMSPFEAHQELGTCAKIVCTGVQKFRVWPQPKGKLLKSEELRVHDTADNTPPRLATGSPALLHNEFEFEQRSADLRRAHSNRTPLAPSYGVSLPSRPKVTAYSD